MFKTTAVACLLFVLLSAPALAEESPTLFPAVYPDAIRFVVAFSPDRQVGTMIFNNFDLATRLGRAERPNAELKKFTFVLRPESKSDVFLTQHLRGYVSTRGAASASLVICAGGNTTVVDMKKAIQDSRAKSLPQARDTHEAATKEAKAKGMELHVSSDKDDNYFVAIDTRVPAGKPLQTTIVMLVDRVPGDEDSSALLALDTIDVVVKAAPPMEQAKTDPAKTGPAKAPKNADCR